MTPIAQNDDAGYSIGAVARLTGISTHTLRIWERRYGTVVARRTPTGRRVYSRLDVEKLSLLKLLSDHGFAIGQIAGLSLEELRARRSDVAEHITSMQRDPDSPPLRIAALTGFSLARLRAGAEADSGIELVVAESDYSRFRNDVRRLNPELLLLEIPVVAADTRRRIGDLRAICDAQRIVVLYNFGHPRVLDELTATQVELIRSPASLHNLLTVLRSGGTMTPPPKKAVLASETTVEALPHDEMPPRRFSEAELSRLADAKTRVACECPRHLADLIQSLSAFEDYSEQCESDSEDDAALHRYLQSTAARARALIEQALHTLATTERLLH